MTENDARAGARAGAGQHSRQWQAGKPAGSPGSATARPGETATRPGETATRAAGTATGTGGTAKDAASGGAGKRAADLLPSVSLPKGGGAVRGLGERFSVDAATGTAAMAVPVPLSPGRSGFTPSLDLAYDSASGNGPLGFGWSLGVPAISRKTSKGLPQYRDGDESDVFLLAGADDLVPVLDQAGEFLTVTRTVHKTPFRISYYRPRVEGLFARIERWTATRTGLSHWRTISRDNVTALYGTDPASTIADPADPSRIFAWNICLSWDDMGNAAVYGYIAEDSAGVDQSAASEANRTTATRASQVYLKTIQYGNPQPYFPDWTSDTPTELPARLDVQGGARLRRPRRLTAGSRSRPALAAASRPVLFLPRRVRRPHLPAGRAAAVLQQLPGRADRGPGLPDQVARPRLLRSAGAARSAQPPSTPSSSRPR